MGQKENKPVIAITGLFLKSNFNLRLKSYNFLKMFHIGTLNDIENILALF